MQGPGRTDIVNAGSWETSYSKCRVRDSCYSGCRECRQTADIIQEMVRDCRHDTEMSRDCRHEYKRWAE
ncbi:unnamed protein product, partial [Staurois parvus]